MSERNISDYNCPLEATLSIFSGKYKIIIIWYLMIKSPLRYGELQKLIPKVTPKVLTQQLRDLEKDGIIFRKVIPTVPVRTEYSLTDFGKTFVPIILSMHEWGMKLFEKHGITDICDDHELIEQCYTGQYTEFFKNLIEKFNNSSE